MRGGAVMNTEMQRKLETTVKKWAENDSSQPLLIQGARRVGKTFLVENAVGNYSGIVSSNLIFKQTWNEPAQFLTGQQMI